MIELTILGTTAGPPTKERGHPAAALKYNGDIYLFDCGENTQRQLRIAGLSIYKVKAIFITHWHADHFAGLLGLLQTLTLLERKEPLYIFGPKPAKLIIDSILKLVQYAHFTGHTNLGYELVAKEIESGLVHDAGKFAVEAIPAKHSVASVSYKFSEKDKPGKFNLQNAKKLGLKPVQFGILQRGGTVKIGEKTIKPGDVMGEPRQGFRFVYTGDTGYNEKLVKFSENADLLIHESTYCTDWEELAGKIGHSTAKQAAEIAKKAKVKKLILTHISSRYKDSKVVLAEARKVFRDTEIAKDLMKVVLK